MIEPSGLAMTGMTEQSVKKLLRDNGTELDDVFLLTVSEGRQYDLIRKDEGK